MLIQLHLANALLCLLLAAYFLFIDARQAAHTARTTPKRVLGLNFAIFAHQSIALVAILYGTGFGFQLLRPAVAMLIGPAMYTYFSSVQRPDNRLQSKDSLHFALGLVIIVLLLLVHPLRQLIDLAIITSFITYFILIAKQMRHGRQSLAHLGDYADTAYRWLSVLMASSFISIALEIAIVFELRLGIPLRDSLALLVAAAAFLLINTITIFAALVRSNWLEWMIEFGEQNLPKTNPNIDSEAATILFQRWDNLVHSENLHQLEFGITLSQAAKKLGVPARHLSNAINQHYGTSYSVYLNDQRITEAKRLLASDAQLSITDIMLASGFSSKSNFNKEFLRVTGMSPSAYRERSLENNEGKWSGTDRFDS